MRELPIAELERLGLDAARAVGGASAVERVEVQPTVDGEGRPSYRFTHLVAFDRAGLRPGTLLIRTRQKLVDALFAQGEETHPTVRLLDRADWDRRAGA